MISSFLIVLASFCLVALRAIQQQNVIHRYYWWAAGTSYAIAIADIALILYVVKTGWESAVWIGTGGALGVTFAMYVHQRFIVKKV